MSWINTHQGTRQQSKKVYLTSSPTPLYPNNEPWNFTVQLPIPLDIDESWSVCLLSLLHINDLNEDPIFIECDFVHSSFVDEYSRNVIAMIPPTNHDQYDFYEPINPPFTSIVATQPMREMTLYIKNISNEFATTLVGRVTIALLFKRN